MDWIGVEWIWIGLDWIGLQVGWIPGDDADDDDVALKIAARNTCG